MPNDSAEVDVAVAELENLDVVEETPAVETEAVETHEPEAAPESEPAAAEPEADAKPKGLDEEAQAIFDREIGKEKAKVRAELESARAKLEAAEARNAESDAIVAERLQLDPTYLSKEDHAMVLEANKLQERKNFLLEHFDGIESEDLTVAKTAAEVRREFATVDAKLGSIQSRANSSYDAAKRLQLSDMKAGRALREQRAALAKTAKAPVVPAKKPGVLDIKPVATTPARRPVAKGSFNEAAFTESRKKLGDKAAAAAALDDL
jgi:hypothetical protein